MKFKRKSSREIHASDNDEQDLLLNTKREGRHLTKDSDVSLPDVGDCSDDEDSFRLPVREVNASHGPYRSESADDESDDRRSESSPSQRLQRSLSTGRRARLRSPHGVQRALPRRNSAPKTDADPDKNDVSLGSPNVAGRNLADVI